MNRTGCSINVAADEWRRSIVSEEHMIRQLPPGRVFSIRYEDLCSDVKGSLIKLFEFIGVNSSYDVKDYREVEHHILGNRMRMKTSSEIRLDQRWRIMLTKESLDTFEHVAGRINSRYGYV